MIRRRPRPTLVPYTTLFRSRAALALGGARRRGRVEAHPQPFSPRRRNTKDLHGHGTESGRQRSEEHTSELQSPCNLVCRLLLEKKNSGKSRTKRNASPELMD